MRLRVKRICQYCEREFIGTLKSKWCCNAHKQAAYRMRRDAGNVTKKRILTRIHK
jgi:hypothetical protein